MDIEIIRDDFGLDISLVYNDEEVGHMTLEKDIRGNEYTIIDANIIPKFRGRGLYQKVLLKLLEEIPSIKINSVFRSVDAERAWVALLEKLPSKVVIEKIPLKREKTTLYQLHLRGTN
jgi:ribosomal protein S18 acetylase RimI-like enzyme